MKQLSKIAIIALVFSLIQFGEISAANKKSAKICTVAWPPFITITKDKIDGPHTIKVQSILENLGYKPVIKEIPWKRCLDMARDGKIDFIYSASYNEERAEYLEYPESPIEILSYVVVTLEKNNSPEWDGDYHKIPLPVGIPLGFSVGNTLKEKGIQVDTGAMNDIQNFQKLVKGRVNSIIIERSVLNNCLEKNMCSGKKVKVHKKPFKDNKAYFLTVSKKFKNAKEVVSKINQILLQAKAQT